MIFTKDKIYGRRFVQSLYETKFATIWENYARFSKDLGGVNHNYATLSALYAITQSEERFYLTGSRFFAPYDHTCVRDYDFFVCPRNRALGLDALWRVLKNLGLLQTKLVFSEYAQGTTQVSPLILLRQGVEEVIRFTSVQNKLQIDVQIMQDNLSLEKKAKLQSNTSFRVMMRDLYQHYSPGSPLYARDKARRTGAWLAGMSLA